MFNPKNFRSEVSVLWLFLLLMALALCACDRAPPSPPGVEGTIDGPKALTFLYGSYDAKLKAAVWKVAKLPPGIAEDTVLAEGDDALVTIGLAQTVKEGDEERFYLGVVLTPKTGPGEEEFDCDTCEPMVGAAVFVKRGERWQLEANAPFVAKLGFHGGGPGMKLVAIGPNRHGILADTDWLAQGYSGTHISLWTVEQGEISERFSTGVAEASGGACSDDPKDELQPCFEHSLKVKYEPGPVADHYDISLHPDDPDWEYDNEGRHGDLTFRFDGHKYVPVGLAKAVPPAAAKVDNTPWSGPLPDNDPVALVGAFIRADAWGLQLTSDTWPLVTKFTTWVDGPGWDTSTVIEWTEAIGHRESGRKAEVSVRMRTIGELHADGAMMPVLDTSTAGMVTRKFVLENTGSATEPHWKIVEPQDGPHVSVGYAIDVLLPNWCGKRDCRKTAAYRVLREHQDACPSTPIQLNRSCRKNTK
jgi:hypothetical protein